MSRLSAETMLSRAFEADEWRLIVEAVAAYGNGSLAGTPAQFIARRINIDIIQALGDGPSG